MPIVSAASQREVPEPASTPSATTKSPVVSSTPIRDPVIPSQPQPLPQSQPQPQAPLPNQQFLNMISQLPSHRVHAEAQKVAASIQTLKHRMTEATASGNTEEVERLKGEIEKLRPSYEVFAMFLRNKMAASGMAPGGGPPRAEGSAQPPSQIIGAFRMLTGRRLISSASCS